MRIEQNSLKLPAFPLIDILKMILGVLVSKPAAKPAEQIQYYNVLSEPLLRTRFRRTPHCTASFKPAAETVCITLRMFPSYNFDNCVVTMYTK